MFLAASGVACAASAGPRDLPSPDWRDQVVYFVMIDRFADGDARNNDQGAGEYDPADGRKFSGGDLAGIAAHAGYIRGLGATAVWITPPVANQWWNARVQYGGYHGYWATDFSAVDAHFGTLADYESLARTLHGDGLYLIQDVVVNHVADYFEYGKGWNPADPAAHVALTPDSRGLLAPVQAPFDRNDPRRERDRDAAIYHWTPSITDFNDPKQWLDFQLAGLDDLNTENAMVRDALRASYGRWIRDVGVDGFRVDTAFYVPADYFDDFLHADDAEHPGMERVAAQAGRKAFLSFGEGFALDQPYDDASMRRIAGYMTGKDGRELLPGMLDFPLYGSLAAAFARGGPTAELGWRIGARMRDYPRPWLMPTFVDNHDVERFLAGGNESGLKQALLALMTLPGIPVVYYGTEQGFTGQRAAMFARGVDSGGKDRFDANSPLYRYLQRAIALRRGDKVFSRGMPTVLAGNAAGPGALAWRMDYEGERAFVAFNTADTPALLDNLETGLPAGTRLQGAFAIDGVAPQLVADANGRIDVVLPPHAGFAWKAGADRVPPPASNASLSIDPLSATAYTGDVEVHGEARGVSRFELVLDGDLAHPVPVEPDRDGHWRTTLPSDDLVDPAIAHRLVAWSEETQVASPPREFHVARAWTPRADVADPAGDDAGPAGKYVYPNGADWRGHRPADLRRVRAWGSGGALKVELTLGEVMAQWNPANGFDHVAFTLFLQLPGRGDGATVMPFQNANVPEGMRWNLRLRASGWSNALFDARNASATNEGTAVSPAPGIAVDRARNTVAFSFPAAALGRPATLSGAKLYISTWDIGEGPRRLQQVADDNGFGGGDGARDPLVMDESAVVELR
ncbi:MAG TPA: alpha-amylase family glycosyl hydrolase [Lysobacter sp.]|nr:alpha-amylase family glycosyl hydrolase [Lysobacter sp.]